jgi:cation-transporting P-type ATPase E
MSEKPFLGLTNEQVEERHRLGQSNRPSRFDFLQYTQIVSGNVFTLFNAAVVPAAVVLLILHDYRGAIAVSGMAIVNTVVGLFQEIATKRRLQKLVTQAEPKARVLRDGRMQEIPSGEVVLGDHLLLAAGEMVVADGLVLEAKFLEIDEALLTGESDPVRRHGGDNLLSGSFCVVGEGAYRVDSVGDKTYGSRIASQARKYRYVASPLLRMINRLIKSLSFTAIGLSILSVGFYLLGHLTKTESVQMVAATVTSLVPQGMVVTATVAFTLSAVRMARRRALFQRLCAVESMASVDVLCMDKTGTLTTNRQRLDRVHVLAGDLPETEVRRRLGLFASASVDRRDRGLQALRDALGTVDAVLLDQIPFQARNRYSAVHVRDGRSEHALVLGAYEALSGQLEATDHGNWESTWTGLLPSGLRILLFAEARPCGPLAGILEGVRLRPLAFVCFSDEIRPGVENVLAHLAGQGISLKILSGDNPETVKATVGRLWPQLGEEPVLSGRELDAAADPNELIRTRSVFGRVSPSQKILIIQRLQEAGHHVAMIGDGINDVLSIKRADLGIALGEGSQASQVVAGLVLANNDFALLPEILDESRIIVRNIRCSCKMFLVKNVYSFLMIVVLFPGLLGLHYPFLPQQVTLLNFLSIGLPALVVAFSRGQSSGGSRMPYFHEVGWFALRTGILFAGAGLLLLWLSIHAWGENLETQRTLLLSALILLGLTGMIRASTDGESRPRVAEVKFYLLPLVCVALYLAVMYWPPSADFFRLTSLSSWQWVLAVGVVVPVYALSLLTDRIHR